MIQDTQEHPPMASVVQRSGLGKGFPRVVGLMELTEFEKFPYRAFLKASAGDFGTLIYTTGMTQVDGKPRLGHVEVAVIIPAEEYRRLAIKAGEVDPEGIA